MRDYIGDPRQCEPIEEELAELALGILSGRRRSEVLRHAGSCERCSAELDQLSIVADTMLRLAPEGEPPLGFELRLAERLQVSAVERQPRRIRRASVLSAVAVLAVVLGFGLGEVATPRGGNNQSQAATGNLTSADLSGHGHVLGERQQRLVCAAQRWSGAFRQEWS
jgi:anti-sigma factor RsiW